MEAHFESSETIGQDPEEAIRERWQGVPDSILHTVDPDWPMLVERPRRKVDDLTDEIPFPVGW